MMHGQKNIKFTVNIEQTTVFVKIRI